MNILLTGILIVLLATVALQDFRQRAISWLLIPALLLVAGSIAFRAFYVKAFLPMLAINAGFILLQLICLTLYFSIKNSKLINIFDTYIGLGDVLFFFVLAVLFSPVNFMLFYTGSLLLIITVFIIRRNRKNIENIPLAGAMASMMILCLVLQQLPVGFNCYSDHWLLSLIVH